MVKISGILAVFTQNSVFEAVLALQTNFFTKISLKIPPMMIGHVVGPHRYLHGVPGLLYLLIVTIILDLTCSFQANFGQLGSEKWSLWAYSTIQVPCKDNNWVPQHSQSSQEGILRVTLVKKIVLERQSSFKTCSWGKNSNFQSAQKSLF